jgi:hypothetical protein
MKILNVVDGPSEFLSDKQTTGTNVVIVIVEQCWKPRLRKIRSSIDKWILHLNYLAFLRFLLSAMKPLGGHSIPFTRVPPPKEVQNTNDFHNHTRYEKGIDSSHNRVTAKAGGEKRAPYSIYHTLWVVSEDCN